MIFHAHGNQQQRRSPDTRPLAIQVSNQLFQQLNWGMRCCATVGVIRLKLLTEYHSHIFHSLDIACRSSGAMKYFRSDLVYPRCEILDRGCPRQRDADSTQTPQTSGLQGFDVVYHELSLAQLSWIADAESAPYNRSPCLSGVEHWDILEGEM